MQNQWMNWSVIGLINAKKVLQKMRQGLTDPIVAEGITSMRNALSMLAGTICLTDFLFQDIQPSVRAFVARALQKEIANAIRGKVKTIDMPQSTAIYMNEELQAILEKECGGVI